MDNANIFDFYVTANPPSADHSLVSLLVTKDVENILFNDPLMADLP